MTLVEIDGEDVLYRRYVIVIVLRSSLMMIADLAAAPVTS